MQSIKGMVALVTGGGSGLGHAVVDCLLRKGARGVISLDLRPHPDSKATNLHQVTGDVTDEADVELALDICRSAFNEQLDVVVNCAGVSSFQRVYDFRRRLPHDLEEFGRLVKVNVVGTFNVTRLAVGLIGRKKSAEEDKSKLRGVVINTSSVSAFDGQIGQVAYAASAGAVVGMTLPLARDLAAHGIRCVTIAPGIFNTPLLDSLPETVRKNLASTVPCPKREGEGNEFAHLVGSIIENPMINGEVIRLDGALRQQP